MPHAGVDLPYWDGYLRQLEAEPVDYDHQVLHSHVGCWDDPTWSNRVSEHYALAAESMCQKVCAAAGVDAGQRVLDVGCGLGTVVASINQRVEPIDLVGVNIDARQLAIARKGVPPRGANHVDFVTADAGRLPFAEDAFDRLLALECTFHFESREGFLQEAHRVLRPGARYALCEHFLTEQARPASEQRRQSRIWGPFMEPCKVSRYCELAEAAGFELVEQLDVTRLTVPTYPGIRQLMRRGLPWPKRWQAVAMLWFTEWLMRRGRLKYMILAFEARG